MNAMTFLNEYEIAYLLTITKLQHRETLRHHSRINTSLLYERCIYTQELFNNVLVNFTKLQKTYMDDPLQC